jgi:hypothetical protein
MFGTVFFQQTVNSERYVRLKFDHTRQWRVSSVSVPSVQCAGCMWTVLFKIRVTTFLCRTPHGRHWYVTDKIESTVILTLSSLNWRNKRIVVRMSRETKKQRAPPVTRWPRYVRRSVIMTRWSVVAFTIPVFKSRGKNETKCIQTTHTLIRRTERQYTCRNI